MPKQKKSSKLLGLLKAFSFYKKYESWGKFFLGFIGTVIVLVVFILPAVLVISQGVEIASKLRAYNYIGAGLQYKNTISVSGEGKIYTRPDIALVNLSVVSEGTRVANVQSENTKKSNQVIGFLKDSKR